MKWEYRLVEYGCRNHQEMTEMVEGLQTASGDGYELAAMVSLEMPATVGRGGTGSLLLVMKRPRVEPKPEAKPN